MLKSDPIARAIRVGHRVHFSLVALLSICFSVGLLQAQRQTVFVLVDESGSLKADRAGWRKQAASLLAYSLSDGSSMSLSGFGNSGRSLDLTPLSLDSSVAGNRRRQSLSETAAELKDGDRQTDLYGAIHAALVETSKMDPSLKRSAPPVLVVLSDFRPDPSPSLATQQGLCEDLQTSHVDFVEVGFGDLDRKTSDYLAKCAGTSLWGAISDPAALPEVFWKLQNRFTRSLKILEEHSGKPDIQIPIPNWADELLILALSEKAGHTTGTWNWSGKDLIQVTSGEAYRLGRLLIKHDSQRSSASAIHVSNPEGVKLVAVARGPLVLSLSTDPPSPWFRSETICTVANLTSAKTGEKVTDWEAAAAAQYSGELRVSDGSSSPLRYDAETKSFRGTWAAPASTRLKAQASISIDGAIWSSPLEGEIASLPVKLALDEQGRITLWSWMSKQFVKFKVSSAIPNRTFDLTFDMIGPFEVEPKTFRFDAAVSDVSAQIRTLREVPGQGLTNLFENRQPEVGYVRISIKLPSGQAIFFPTVIPVVMKLRPVWVRVLIAMSLLAALVIPAFSLMLGRKLPPWFLVATDAAGQPTRGVDPIRLHSFRRSLDLKQFGMPGAVIYRTILGRVGVRLDGNVALNAPGGSAPFDAVNANIESTIRVGDCLYYRRGDGSVLLYKIEVF